MTNPLAPLKISARLLKILTHNCSSLLIPTLLIKSLVLRSRPQRRFVASQTLRQTAERLNQCDAELLALVLL